MFQVNPRQRIHVKNQALFSSKDKSKILKCCLLQFLFDALMVKTGFFFCKSCTIMYSVLDSMESSAEKIVPYLP